jgi:putative SOS response-associated peptidase YedK
MCGRYTLVSSAQPEIHKLGLSLPDRFNIAPQSEVLIQTESGACQLRRWGYSPNWAQPSLEMHNARSETLLEKSVFKHAGRCAFFADGWYEWQRVGTRKTPWYHHMNGALLMFAGIYGDRSGCAIVTAPAEAGIAHVHPRQPMLLTEDTLGAWLAGADAGGCMREVVVQCYRVAQRVNRANVDEASLLEPLAEGVTDHVMGQALDLFGE